MIYIKISVNGGTIYDAGPISYLADSYDAPLADSLEETLSNISDSIGIDAGQKVKVEALSREGYIKETSKIKDSANCCVRANFV